MTVLGVTELGDGRYNLILDHDPTVTATDALTGSIATYETTADQWKKFDDGLTTNWELIVADGFSGITNEPTGYPNQTDSQYTFTDGTRTFAISPVATEFDYWQKGTKYTVTSTDSVVITDTEGVHFIYYDGTTLYFTTTYSDEIITEWVLTSVVYWDVSTQTHLLLADERHGLIMDGVTHLQLHTGLGTLYVSGLGLGDINVDASGNLDSGATISVKGGVIRDEDIKLTLSAMASPANIPVFYKSGTNDWNRDTATDFPVKNFSGGSGRLAYNEFTGGVWQQTEAGQNDFVLAHIIATDDLGTNFIAIQGEEVYDSIPQARIGASKEINTISLSGLPLVEFVPIGSIIYQTSSTYGNTPQARIRATDLGDDYIDWRDSTISGGGGSAGVTNHGDLAGLTNPDHPAIAICTDTTNFDGILSIADDTVQKALDTIDDALVTGPTGPQGNQGNQGDDGATGPTGATGDEFHQYHFYADQLMSPNTADWTVNVLAPSSADSNNSGLVVRLFNDTTEEGVGGMFDVPTGTTNIIIGIRSRAETSAASLLGIVPTMHVREMPDNAAVEAWSAGTDLTMLTMGTSNEFFQYDEQTIALTTLGLVAGRTAQFEITRNTASSSDTLIGDWAVLEIIIGLS